jgi:hypothetical protein
MTEDARAEKYYRSRQACLFPSDPPVLLEALFFSWARGIPASLLLYVIRVIRDIRSFSSRQMPGS